MKRIAWAALAAGIVFTGNGVCAARARSIAVKGVHALPGSGPADPARRTSAQHVRQIPNRVEILERPPDAARRASARSSAGPTCQRDTITARRPPIGTPSIANAYQRNGKWLRGAITTAPYVRPSGWYYRRWTYGQALPAMFWGRNYWISSWGEFRSSWRRHFGYQWVRYGDDAILVDASTGQILQVQYGVFY